RRSAIVLICYGFVAFGALAERGAAEHALWTAVDRLRARGISAAEIDAGYTVNGWLQYAHPDQAHRDRNGAVAVPWMNADSKLPWVVGQQPLAGTMVVEEIPYRRMLRAPGVIAILRRLPVPARSSTLLPNHN